MTTAQLTIPTPHIFGHREDLGYLLNEHGLLGKGAEIGVQEGFNSEAILSKWQGERLYSIDPWKSFEAKDYLDIANVDQQTQDLIFQAARKRLSKFGSRSRIIRMTSLEASSKMGDETLDFVYIDAQHTFEAVMQDIHAWYPKVRSGGILGGHDYVPDGLYTAGLFGVKGAVDQFAAENNLDLFYSNDGPTLSWYFFKP